MTGEHWRRLKDVFLAAIDQPAEQRHAWLQQACGGDTALLRDAEALLASHDTAEGFLEEPAHIEPNEAETLPQGFELGPYRIVSELGRGGMGVVYLARDTRLGRDVALKTLPPVLAANGDLRVRLRREAAAAAKISHAAVATVFALEEIDDQLIIVSEYVPGTTLRTILSEGPMTPSRAASLAAQVAAALAAAHAVGVVHRDLKPENVLVTPAGAVKVVDFGIAHVEAPEYTHLTRTGATLGTPAYMAPEQLLGGAIDARADVYSFGILFTEMLTGRHPLSGPGATVPPPFAAIIARCVSTDAAARYASGAELMSALAAEAPAIARLDSSGSPGSPTWWWEFHQAITALVYWLMTWPAWKGRQIIGGTVGRALFITLLIAVIVAANLRLHLWFTSRFYAHQLRWARRRASLWIRAADWLFVGSLALMGLLVGEDRSPIAIVLIAVAVGASLAFLVIERATTRAAFRSSSNRATPHSSHHPE